MNKVFTACMSLALVITIISCRKDNSPAGGGGVTDADGNRYDTIRIGTQVWMVQNLRTTKYNDGTPIPTGLSNDDWRTTKKGAYAIYDNKAANDATYGKLYNWYAVGSGKLAPKGWHVSTREDWSTLIKYLDGNNKTGGKLKSATGWDSPNTGADNSSGFSGLPGGTRAWGGGGYYDMGKTAYFWTTGEYVSFPDYAWYLKLFHDKAETFSTSEYKMQGMSVRCVKD
jgi:uncharacterized protein (TIGR02145 family)